MDETVWRALAIGYGAALLFVAFVGFSWWVPVVAIGVSVGTVTVWR